MSGKKRTKRQKQRAQEKRKQGEISGFRIKAEKLDFDEKDSQQAGMVKNRYRSYLRADLTKTIILTMLAVALELVLWRYLI